MAAKNAVPSPFAVLLKQSKFASYDPAINQVYTTHGGHAHRGNWGFKRPLPLRTRRNNYITVQAVDSLHQQTEWNSAQRQTRFIKRWDEIGADVRVEPTDPGSSPSNMWINRAGPQAVESRNEEVDSEFCPSRPVAEIAREDAAVRAHLDDPNLDKIADFSTRVPNVQAMAPHEFERYLRGLRRQRGAFREYVRKRAAAGEEEALLLLSRVPPKLGANYNDWHMRFLAYTTTKDFIEEGSRKIEERPHRVAGLTYTRSNQLQHKYMSQPVPGMALQLDNATRNQWYAVTYAGLTAGVEKAHDAGEMTPVFQTTENEVQIEHTKRPTTKFVHKRVALQRAPVVVGLRQGLKATKISVTARNAEKSLDRFGVANPHAPWTREYNAMEKSLQRFGKNTTMDAAFRAPPSSSRPRSPLQKGSEAAKQQAGSNVLQMLNKLASNKPKPKPK